MVPCGIAMVSVVRNKIYLFYVLIEMFQKTYAKTHNNVLLKHACDGRTLKIACQRFMRFDGNTDKGPFTKEVRKNLRFFISPLSITVRIWRPSAHPVYIQSPIYLCFIPYKDSFTAMIFFVLCS